MLKKVLSMFVALILTTSMIAQSLKFDSQI